MRKNMDYSEFKLLTFDVVGTLIDFETGIVDFFNKIGSNKTPETVLEAFGRAECQQQTASPTLPFTQMLDQFSNEWHRNSIYLLCTDQISLLLFLTGQHFRIVSSRYAN